MKHLYGMYYGGNSKPKEISFDRITAESCPNALIIGKEGAEATCIAMNEITSNLLHGDREDKIIVVDVNGDYKKFAKENGGEIVDFRDTFVNPCDMVNYRDGTGEMAEYLISLIEIIAKRKCESIQKAIVNEACSSMYGFYKIKALIEKKAIKRSECPTLSDFCEKLKLFEAEIEPCYKGMLNTFAHRTNIDTNNRLTVIDLSSMDEEKMPVALQVSLMYIWSVMTENRCKQAYTWVYFEELQKYFSNMALAETLSDIFRHSNELNGVITGITRKAKNLFFNEQGRNVLYKAGNIILLSNDEEEAEQLKGFYNIPDCLVDFITDKSCSGLVQFDRFYKGSFVPFTSIGQGE